jgi:hypothetical protein
MKDLLLNESGDFKIKDNDLSIGEADGQNINDILQSVKGDYKRSPQTGLNAISFLNGNASSADIKAQVKLQLELDGFRVKDIIIGRTKGNITIEPYAER